MWAFVDALRKIKDGEDSSIFFFLLCHNANVLHINAYFFFLVFWVTTTMAELMVLGFISLLLGVFQTRIEKICISERLANVWLPCKKPDSSSTVTSFASSSFTSSRTQGRRLLAEASAATDFCSQKVTSLKLLLLLLLLL